MKLIKYICDKCGNDIGGVMYTLTCYAEDIIPLPFGGCSTEVEMQNARQNRLRQQEERHLCKSCKDAITDGIFIV